MGIYRSGTSLISGTLHHLGIDVGRHEFDSDPIKNPKGFWECQDLWAINEYFRARCGKTRFELNKDDIKKIIDDPTANERVRKYIGKRNEKDVWAMKDPMIVPFFELYEKYLTDPYYIFIERATESVINSWQAIATVPLEEVIDAYWNHREMVDDIRQKAVNSKIPHTELYYGWYVDNREEACQKLADFVGVPITKEAIEFCQQYSLKGTK